jgi:hypothetical protein
MGVVCQCSRQPRHSVHPSFCIDVPANAKLLEVKLIGSTANTDIDLLVRRGGRVEIDVNGNALVDGVSATLKNLESLIILTQDGVRTSIINGQTPKIHR